VQSREMMLKSIKLLCPESKDLAHCRAILEAIEEEQMCIAQDLHDSVCQSLSGLRLSAAALRRKVGEMDGKPIEEFSHLEGVAARVIAELHDLVSGLQPVEIAPAELSFALEDLSRELKPHISCYYRCVGRPAVSDGYVASQVARIARSVAKLVIAKKKAARMTFEWEQGVNDSMITITVDQPAFAEMELTPTQLLNWKLIYRRAGAIGAAISVEQGGTAFVLKLRAEA
jgi:signal transduction histidine kinase